MNLCNPCNPRLIPVSALDFSEIKLQHHLRETRIENALGPLPGGERAVQRENGARIERVVEIDADARACSFELQGLADAQIELIHPFPIHCSRLHDVDD